VRDGTKSGFSASQLIMFGHASLAISLSLPHIIFDGHTYTTYNDGHPARIRERRPRPEDTRVSDVARAQVHCDTREGFLSTRSRHPLARGRRQAAQAYPSFRGSLCLSLVFDEIPSQSLMRLSHVLSIEKRSDMLRPIISLGTNPGSTSPPYLNKSSQCSASGVRGFLAIRRTLSAAFTSPNGMSDATPMAADSFITPTIRGWTSATTSTRLRRLSWIQSRSGRGIR
jgi:hypothetical protein